MKTATLETRGVTNHHGGFEQFAGHFTLFSSENGATIAVYNSYHHPYQKNV